MKAFIIILSAFLLTTGCSSSMSLNINDNKSNDSLNNFVITIPKEFNGALIRNDQSLAYWNYDDRTAHRKSQDILIEVYPNESLSPSSPCSPDTLGEDAPHWTPLEHIVQTHDVQRDILTITAMQPPEPPPVEMEPQRLQEWKENERYRYLFCSTHAGKSVKIVITQVQDNPTLAQKIFETFRWKE